MLGRDASQRPVHPEDDLGEPVDLAELDARVDHVIADHRVVMGTLEHRARADASWAGFTQPVGERKVPRTERRAWDPREVHHSEDVLRDREQRARALRELDPGLVRPRLDDPMVTRAGVFYVAPRFDHAADIEPAMDVTLVRAGFRTLLSFLKTPDTEVARILGVTPSAVARMKDDLRLESLPGVDDRTADLLRLAGVHSISRLARAEPAVLLAEVEALVRRHRFLDVPADLSSLEGVERLIVAAGR